MTENPTLPNGNACYLASMPGRQKLPVIQVSIALVMLFQVSSLLVREFVRLKLGQSGIDAASAKHLSALAGFGMLAILMWPLLRTLRPQLTQLRKWPDSWSRLVFFSIGIGLAMRVASWAKMVALISFGFYGPGNPAQAAGPTFWWQCPAYADLLLSVVVMAILTPIVEELIHRGLLLSALLRRGRFQAILFSAILFATLHALDDMFLAFIFGLVAAVQMLEWRTLWAPLISHATFNGMIAIDWDCLHGVWIPATTSMPLGAIATALGVLSVLVAAWLARAGNAEAGYPGIALP